MANFVFKFVTFRYCVNKGQCAETWITVKLIDLQNTQFGAQNLGLILHLSAFIVNIVCIFADFS